MTQMPGFPMLANFLDNGFVSPGLLIAGAAMMTLFFVMRSSRRRRGPEGRPLTAHEEIERNRQLRGMRGDLERIMVEIEEMARRVSAQIDNKSAQLERLIDEADQRIADLQKLQSSAGGAPIAPGDVPVKVGPAQMPGAEAGGEGPVKLSDDPLAVSVCQLADQGLAPADIARQLNEHIGKIELILALRNT